MYTIAYESYAYFHKNTHLTILYDSEHLYAILLVGPFCNFHSRVKLPFQLRQVI